MSVKYLTTAYTYDLLYLLSKLERFLTTNIRFNSISELLAHRGEMILLDHIESWSENHLEASVLHRDITPFSDQDGNTPAWVGIEYMAQTIGALAGVRALENNRPVKIGFLLGTRKYQSQVAKFLRNEKVIIRVDLIFFGENNLAAFDCIISSNRILAEAQIKVIQPDNTEDVLKDN